jgi:hypothetical protein
LDCVGGDPEEEAAHWQQRLNLLAMLFELHLISIYNNEIRQEIDRDEGKKHQPTLSRNLPASLAR